ncbi:uncharacterized protein LOC131671853 [Phymastichus coffea]|uniref:uncharacterized protein LOC131671853 n=1 Tax=Phymastichus coffea TaxID=108790 RepID=UPI00273AB610|nr:uncharacterized protein LOC131671853 [Phymastichus coffea]
MKNLTEKNIDNEQPQTVEGHLDAIMIDESFIDSNYKKVTVDDLPDWYDEELFKRGQLYYNRNVLSIHIAYLIGLIAVFLIPTIAKILTFTKQTSTPCLAYKRYLQTMIHVIKLHEHDIKNSHSKFYKSLNTIRWKHSTSSKRSQENKHNGILQKDMVLTQFAFVGYVLLKSEKLGFTNETADRQAFNHFWRVVGHLLGIPDRLNICRKNEFETTLLCQKIITEISNILKDPAVEFHALTKTALQGLRAIDPTFDTDVFYKIFYEIHKSEYKKEFNLYSNIIYVYRKSVIASFRIPIVGPFSRIFWNKYVKIVNWIAENLPLIAWIKFGKTQSKIYLYPHSTI